MLQRFILKATDVIEDIQKPEAEKKEKLEKKTRSLKKQLEEQEELLLKEADNLCEAAKKFQKKCG